MELPNTTWVVLLQHLSHAILWRIKQICRPSGSPCRNFSQEVWYPALLFFFSAVNSHLVVVHNTDPRYLIGQHPCGEERQYCKNSRNPLQEGAAPRRGRALSVLTGNVSASLRPALNVSHKGCCSKKKNNNNNFTRNTTSQLLAQKSLSAVYSGC